MVGTSNESDPGMAIETRLPWKITQVDSWIPRWKPPIPVSFPLHPLWLLYPPIFPPIPPIRRWSILSIPYIMVLFPHTSLYSHVYVPYILHLFSICHIPPIYLRLVNFPPTFPPSSTPSSSEEGTCEATRSASHGAGGAAIVQGWAQFQGHVQRATGQGREGQFWTFGICPWKNHGRLWFNIFNQQWWSIANQHGTIGQTTWVLWHNLCI